MRSSVRALVVLAAVAVGLVGCGGNPAGPSDGGVTVSGLVLAGSAALPFHASAGARAADEPVKVTVVGTSIETTVGPDGSFTLRGLPAGDFDLAFTQGASSLGTLRFSGVKANQEITITVAVTSSSVTLLEQKRNGIGHGDLEIEGLVEARACGVGGSPTCSAAGESRFVIDGRTVVARPGQTAIREGNTARTVEDVTVGRRVHVKGTWLPSGGSVQPVLAAEIKLQGDDDGRGPFACVAGARAEVEGTIDGKLASSILVRQQGKGLFECVVDGKTTIRKGNTTYTFAQLQQGWRVHVKGSVTGPGSSGSCLVAADEVKVQQGG